MVRTNVPQRTLTALFALLLVFRRGSRGLEQNEKSDINGNKPANGTLEGIIPLCGKIIYLL